MAAPCLTSTLRRACGLFLVLLVLCPAIALAQSDEPTDDESAGLLLGARGVGEVWQDTYLVRELGRSSRFGGGGFISYRAWRFLSVDFEAGYHSLTGMAHTPETSQRATADDDQTSFELIPMALSVSASHRIDRVEVFGAVGCAITAFTHSSRNQTITGTKFGPAFQAGARFDTGLVQQSIRRDAKNVLQSVDLELVLGRRQHQPFGVGTGFDLSAWRVGVGLVARL